MIDNDNVAVKRIIAAGGAVGNVDLSTIEVRVNDGSNMFAKDDEFTFPGTLEDWKKVTFRRSFNGNNAFGILVEVNGVTKEFYFSSFTKSVLPYGEDGKQLMETDGVTPAKAIPAEGTAVALWKQGGNVEDSINKLLGQDKRKIKVTNIQSIPTMRQRANGTRTMGHSWVMTLDLV